MNQEGIIKFLTILLITINLFSCHRITKIEGVYNHFYTQYETNSFFQLELRSNNYFIWRYDDAIFGADTTLGQWFLKKDTLYLNSFLKENIYEVEKQYISKLDSLKIHFKEGDYNSVGIVETIEGKKYITDTSGVISLPLKVNTIKIHYFEDVQTVHLNKKFNYYILRAKEKFDFTSWIPPKKLLVKKDGLYLINNGLQVDNVPYIKSLKAD